MAGKDFAALALFLCANSQRKTQREAQSSHFYVCLFHLDTVTLEIGFTGSDWWYFNVKYCWENDSALSYNRLAIAYKDNGFL